MTLWNDIRIGSWLLAKERSVTLMAALALALGIAVNTTVFAIASRISLRDLPLEAPDRLVALNLRLAGNPRSNFALSSLELRDWQSSASRTFEGIAGFGEQTMSVVDSGRPAAVDRLQRPFLGCDFQADCGSTRLVTTGVAGCLSELVTVPVNSDSCDVTDWKRRASARIGAFGSAVGRDSATPIQVGRPELDEAARANRQRILRGQLWVSFSGCSASPWCSADSGTRRG